jgi:hypothetical protein
MTDFERSVRDAVDALEHWRERGVAGIERVAELLEEIAKRAPAEVASLASSSSVDKAELWRRLTAGSVRATGDVIRLALGSELDFELGARLRNAARKLRGASTTLVRLSIERAQPALKGAHA